MESSRTKLFILGGRLFQSPKRIAHAEAHFSHHCEGNVSGKLARNFSTFLRFPERTSLENPL